MKRTGPKQAWGSRKPVKQEEEKQRRARRARREWVKPRGREGGKETSWGGESKEKWKSEVIGGTDSGLYHPAIEDGEILIQPEDSSGWHKEWQC